MIINKLHSRDIFANIHLAIYLIINDLLMETFRPYDCEVMDGDKCIKPWGEVIYGTAGAKFADLGTGNRTVFYDEEGYPCCAK